MNIKATLGALAVLAAVNVPGQAQQSVNKTFDLYGEQPFAPAYQRTSAPFGFIEFCQRHQSECAAVNGEVEAVEMTPTRWGMLRDVNAHVNQQVAPVSDDDLYQTVEHWTYPGIAGDCEDYVLLKKRYLEGLGFPSETLLITVVLDEDGQGHAVLLIKSDSGDYVLDNRRDDVRHWSHTGYKFLKRQSQQHPQIWVSLSRDTNRQHKQRHYGRN